MLADRFRTEFDDRAKPTQYTKKGVPIRGEWIGSKFVRYKTGALRPPDFTPLDWQRLPASVKKEILAGKVKVGTAAACVATDSESEASTDADSTSSRELSDSKVSYKFPKMPVVRDKQEHRSKVPDGTPLFSACVARSVGKREIMSNPGAKKAMDAEWDKLRKRVVWDESGVREWAEVAAKAKNENKKVHVGRVFGICVEKNAELPANDPRRKFKGRVVFQGNNVKDENNEWAIFAELSSAPSTMHAGKAVDA